MGIDLIAELNRFEAFSNQQSDFCDIESVGPSILKVTPKTTHRAVVKIGFLALVHGNETLGLPIVNDLIESLMLGQQVLNFEVYFGLGNIPAALADKRFLQEDLNRCFGLAGESQESQRARELETMMLNHCDYLIDLHQTISEAREPFFIFQYSSNRCLQIIEQINPGIPTVLQSDQIGNSTGLCTDEYMRKNGKWGAALELGQKGTEKYFELGKEICRHVLDILQPLDKYSSERQPELRFPVYNLGGSFKATGSSCKLIDGLENLKEISAGQVVGNSDTGPILFPVNGVILFPRYRPVMLGQELFYFATSSDSADSRTNLAMCSSSVF